MAIHKLCACFVIGLVLLLATPTQAAVPSAGAVCTDNTAGATACYQNGCYTCTAGVWVSQPLQLGATTSACGSSLAGMLRWTGTGFQGCDGTSWQSIGGTACNAPDAFSFTDQTGVGGYSLVMSNALTLAGSNFSCVVSSSCAGCTDIVKNGVSAGITGVTFSLGDTIALELRSSPTGNATVTANVTVGSTTSSTWSVTTADDPCSVESPTPGTVCTDGTVYAGLTPDGNVKMFTTHCDSGYTWSGTACEGSVDSLHWNDGSTSYQSTGATSTTSGQSNTSLLMSLTTNNDYPYEAAKYCNDLVVNTTDDWYLPSKDEMAVLRTNRVAIGNFNLVNWYYWTSTESSSSYAYQLLFANGASSTATKNNAKVTRCTRKATS
ncbi:MAG: hypothetical protein PHD48_06950 [Alphaproteobacteria bacterium]|nr:hypothetical protein [Alphaproteobacteria bacterium]